MKVLAGHKKRSVSTVKRESIGQYLDLQFELNNHPYC